MDNESEQERPGSTKEASATTRETWERFFHWMPVLISVASLGISAAAYFHSRDAAQSTNEINVSRLLNEAADILGGEGTTSLALADSQWPPLEKRVSLELARRKIQEALLRQPESASALRLHGVYLSLSGKQEEALAAVEKSLQIDSQDARTVNTKGIILARLDRVEDSEYYFKVAIGIDPEYASAWLNLGVCMRRQNRTEDSLVALSEALKLDPGIPGGLYDLAIALREQGMLSDAAKMMKYAVATSPNDVTNYELLAAILEEDGFAEEAEQWRDKARKLQIPPLPQMSSP